MWVWNTKRLQLSLCEKTHQWADIPALAGVTAPLEAEVTVDGAERNPLLRSRIWGKRSDVVNCGKASAPDLSDCLLELMCPTGYINGN